jgi:hypothetical protein
MHYDFLMSSHSKLKKLAYGLSITLALALLPVVPASGAVKAGAVCPKVNTSKSVSGTKLICVKSGKKLVWKAVPTDPAAPTSFDDLLANYKGIPAAAWKSAQSNIASSTLATPPIEIIIGSKTKMPYAKSVPENALKKVTGIFKNFSQPPKQTALYYNFNDLNWAKEYLTKFKNPFTTNDTYADQAVEHCPNELQCRGAFGNYAEGTGLIINSVALPEGQWIDYFQTSGVQYIHEFTHTVQKAQFLEANSKFHGGYPFWFSEGQPQVAGFTGGNKTLDEYNEMRLKWMDVPARGLGGYSPADISRFYKLTNNYPDDPNVKNLVYYIGYITVEALTALKGIDSTMNLVKAVALGDTYEQAFKKIYGVEWSYAEPILAQVVSKQFLEVRKYATSNG